MKKIKKIFGFLFVSLFFNFYVCALQDDFHGSVSVILPVYNVADYLEECLDSVINQSYKNLEIICVNDGSTDNSLEILKKYETKDSRIKLIDQKNQGVSSARNQGMKHATGDYIAFVDPDDVLERNAYEIALKKMEKDVDIIVWGYTAFPNATGWWVHAGDNISKIYKNDSINAYFDCKVGCVVWNKLYKKSIIDKHNISFKEDLKMAEDVNFNLDIFCVCNKIQLIEDKLYNYRLKREGSLTDIHKGKSKAENHKKLFENVLNNWKNLNILNHQNSSRLLTYFINITYNTINEISEESDKKAHAKNFLNIIYKYINKKRIETQLDLSQLTRKRFSYIKKLAK